MFYLNIFADMKLFHFSNKIMELKAHDQPQNSGVESLLASFITELLVLFFV